MRKFYWECFKKTKPAYAVARNVTFLLGILLPPTAILYQHFHQEPIPREIMSALIWQIPLGILALLSIIQFIMAPYWLYEELRKQHVNELKALREARRNELCSYIPDANFDRIFRIFFDLYKEGEFLKLTNTERRQKWDEEVIKALTDYSGYGNRNSYIQNTDRRDSGEPLLDENYDKAVLTIHDIVFHSEFNGYIGL